MLLEKKKKYKLQQSEWSSLVAKRAFLTKFSKSNLSTITLSELIMSFKIILALITPPYHKQLVICVYFNSQTFFKTYSSIIILILELVGNLNDGI